MVNGKNTTPAECGFHFERECVCVCCDDVLLMVVG